MPRTPNLAEKNDCCRHTGVFPFLTSNKYQAVGRQPQVPTKRITTYTQSLWRPTSDNPLRSPAHGSQLRQRFELGGHIPLGQPLAHDGEVAVASGVVRRENLLPPPRHRQETDLVESVAVYCKQYNVAAVCSTLCGVIPLFLLRSSKPVIAGGLGDLGDR